MYSWPSSLLASITRQTKHILLSLRENYKRQGYGEALLKTTIQKCKARNICQILLHVDPSRTLAMSLYIKHGFQVNNLIKKLLLFK
ncbi:hypothetical protein AAG906_013543 [Vitis piasezkii]